MQTALADLQQSLQRVRDIAADIGASATAALRDPQRLAMHQTTLDAMTVALSGFFESFLRDLAEAYAESVANKKIPFGSLPPRIRQTHVAGGGKILWNIGGPRIRGPYSWVVASPPDIVRRLQSVHTGTLPYQLVWEAFAETGQNPGPEVLKEFLAQFSVPKPLKTLASQMGRTENYITTTLTSFIKVRNECAHTGTSSVALTASQITGYCDLLEQLAKGLVRVLQMHTI